MDVIYKETILFLGNLSNDRLETLYNEFGHQGGFENFANSLIRLEGFFS